LDSPLKNTIGLDIGNSAIAAVEMAWDKKRGLRVLNFNRVELEPEIVEDDSIIVNPDAFREALGRLMKKGSAGPFGSRQVIVSIPEKKTFSHELSVPAEDAEDHAYLLSAARDYIPIELSDAVMDCKPLRGQVVGKRVSLNCVAVQKSVVESLIANLGEAGLNVAAMDVREDALARCCWNAVGGKGKGDGDLMILSVEPEGSHFMVLTASGEKFTLDSPIGGNYLAEKVRRELGIPTLEGARRLLVEGGEQELKQRGQIQATLRPEMDSLAQKALELRKIVENRRILKLERVFVVDGISGIPSLREALKLVFPEIDVEVGLSISGFQGKFGDYARAMGLAMRAALPGEHEKGVNLLPESRREELDRAQLKPTVLRILLVVCLALTALAFYSGYSAVSDYLAARIAKQGLSVSQEKIQNPYLNKLAQASQMKTRLEDEMGMLLKDAIPLSPVIRKIDGYNQGGIGMVSVSQFSDATGKWILKLHAKADSRETTEQFVSDLEKDPYYSNVNSPLSNLIGKGERFIDIDMNLNPDLVIADHEKQKAAEPAPAASTVAPAEATTPPSSSVSVAPEATKKAVSPTPVPSTNPASTTASKAVTKATTANQAKKK
jgi:Tfp pilus assembly PilM family ATPase